MNQLLTSGQKVQAEGSGIACKVGTFLGGGGQGEVYRATVGGSPVALKWYFPNQATAQQRRTLELLVKRGAPNNKFLWPIDLASAAGVAGFGYIMPLREARYKGIVDLMKRQIEPSFRTLTTAGLELADSYFQLHAKGLCYRDISFGNVFFDPDSGEVLICDNDNVTIDGSTIGGVLGTPRFMAPEVVRHEAMPSRATDLFSLAVLLFYMFLVHHPLEGQRELEIRCMDLPAMTKLYGTDPVFIFDPADTSNRPVPGYQDNAIVFWEIYPQFLRDLFTKAFTDGICDPQHGRIQETVWRDAMVALRDAILHCGHCGSENFYGVETLRASGGKPGTCWACKHGLVLPPRIRIGSNVVMLNHDTKLYPHHTDSHQPYNFSQPTAEVARHPSDPNIWGLRNLSPERWVVTAVDGSTRDVEPGRSVTLAVGTKIHFGNAQGEIRI